MLCACVGASFKVLVCGVGGLLFDVVWFVVVCGCVRLCLYVMFFFLKKKVCVLYV